MMNRSAYVVALVLFMLTPCAFGQTIWFGPKTSNRQMMDLFRPGTDWQNVSSHTKAFEIDARYAFTAPKDDLSKAYRYLSSHGIALAVGVLALTGEGPGRCGFGVEGYSAARGVTALVQRLKSVGVQPRYFVMDEPLWFGHYFLRRGNIFGCRRSISQIADDISTKVKEIHAVFPSAEIGEVEPIGAVQKADINAWVDAYEQAAGGKLAFFRLDMAWNTAWQKQIPWMTDLLQKKGIPLQVIFNGSGRDRSDAEWVAHATEHFKEFHDVSPSQAAAVIQSWDRYPTRLLPESDPNTLTGFANSYIAWKMAQRP